MPVTYGDIVRADLMSLQKNKDKSNISKCCGHVIYETKRGNKYCSQCLKDIEDKK